jgi:RNA polymerase sigma-70 factor (ECF subfamily)
MAAAAVTPRTDDATFSTFLQQAMPAVRQFLRRLCACDADADDVLQETLAKVWRLRAGFDPQQNGDAWLMQAAFRCFCDHRERLRSRGATGGDAASAPAPTAPCATELRDELRHRLQALPPLERALLLGFHADGLSLRELAARHELPVNTVKSHLHRARLRLARSAR